MDSIFNKIKTKRYDERKIVVRVDDRDMRGGDKTWEWIKKGAPIRLEIGPRDVEKSSVFMGRRDLGVKEKSNLEMNEFVETLPNILDDIQNNIFQKALKFREENIVAIDKNDKFYKFFTPKNKEKPEIHGGFVRSHWCGSRSCEDKIKTDLKVTIRNIPFNEVEEEGRCICCGEPSIKRVIFAKSY